MSDPTVQTQAPSQTPAEPTEPAASVTPEPQQPGQTPAPEPQQAAPEPQQPAPPVQEQQAQQTADTQPQQQQPAQGAEPGQDQADQPAGIATPEGLPPQLGEVAQKLGLDQTQFDGALEAFQTFDVARQQAQVQTFRQFGEKYVEDTWGEQKETNLNIAKQALKTFDTSGEITKILNATGYGSHPVVLEFMKSVGEKLQEGGFIQSEVNRPQPKRSPAEVLYGDTHPTANR
jgi:hypothetical protein